MGCGFGTVYEGLRKIGISGDDDVLITGLGPVGLAAGALCRKLGARRIIGIDVVVERIELALRLGLCDEALHSGPDNVAEVRALTGGRGVERAIDCSANDGARAIELAKQNRIDVAITDIRMVGMSGVELLEQLKAVMLAGLTSRKCVADAGVKAGAATELSPDQVMKKRFGIFIHQSQKDMVPFQGSDSREFWQRAEDRNRATARTYDQLGLAEYEAIEKEYAEVRADGVISGSLAGNSPSRASSRNP